MSQHPLRFNITLVSPVRTIQTSKENVPLKSSDPPLQGREVHIPIFIYIKPQNTQCMIRLQLHI
jgi:hypothetical protein